MILLLKSYESLQITKQHQQLILLASFPLNNIPKCIHGKNSNLVGWDAFITCRIKDKWAKMFKIAPQQSA